MAQLEAENRVVLRYSDPEGHPRLQANPNGSLHNVAGILSERGNVLGMMPHPERCAEADLGGTDGLLLFRSVATAAAAALAS
jgi:phosphoribosylformylglycinamidine synthase